MTVNDLIEFYQCKTQSELAKTAHVSLVTVWKWQKNGIPHKTQATFEVMTKGKLKADLSDYKRQATAQELP